MEVTALPQQTRSPAALSAKKVQFREAPREQGAPTLKASSPDRKAAAGAPGAACPELPLSHTNALFSPERQEGGWTISAQRSDRMEASEAADGNPLASPSPLPSLGAASGAYTPASSTWLESARKVSDLQDRLASLEAALKDMESKAVAHLGKSLQEKVLATAAKIVQKRFLADKELDRKLQHQILQTAIKVVKRQDAAKAAAAAASPAPAAEAPAEEAGATPTRRLEFGQGEASSEAASVAAYVAHIEQGLGEVVRRLEKKVDSVAQLLDQNALELLEARLAGGVVQLEARLAALEERAAAQRRPAAPDASAALLERVAAVEAAMVEQSRAVTDLLAALAAQGASQHVGAAVAAAQAQTAAARKAAATQTEVGGQGEEEEEQAQRARRPASSPAKASQQASPPKQQPQRQQREPVQREPVSQLHQRRAALAKRSVLGDPARTSAGAAAQEASPAQSPRVSLPRLKVTHAAGTAQQIAIATARQQLALQAQRAREEAEAETPVWLSMFYLFGWGLMAVLGVAAVLVGMMAALVKAGRLSQSDLEFLWRK